MSTAYQGLSRLAAARAVECPIDERRTHACLARRISARRRRMSGRLIERARRRSLERVANHACAVDVQSFENRLNQQPLFRQAQQDMQIPHGPSSLKTGA